MYNYLLSTYKNSVRKMKMKMRKSPILLLSILWGIHILVVIFIYCVGVSERTLMINIFASMIGGIAMISMTLTEVLKGIVAILNHLVINDINNIDAKISQQLAEMEKEMEDKCENVDE